MPIAAVEIVEVRRAVGRLREPPRREGSRAFSREHFAAMGMHVAAQDVRLFPSTREGESARRYPSASSGVVRGTREILLGASHDRSVSVRAPRREAANGMSPARAELSVRGVAVTVSSVDVDVWPKCSGACGSAHRKHIYYSRYSRSRRSGGGPLEVEAGLRRAGRALGAKAENAHEHGVSAPVHLGLAQGLKRSYFATPALLGRSARIYKH